MTNDGVRGTGGGASVATRVVFIRLRLHDKIRPMKMIRLFMRAAGDDGGFESKIELKGLEVKPEIEVELGA